MPHTHTHGRTHPLTCAAPLCFFFCPRSAEFISFSSAMISLPLTAPVPYILSSMSALLGSFPHTCPWWGKVSDWAFSANLRLHSSSSPSRWYEASKVTVIKLLLTAEKKLCVIDWWRLTYVALFLYQQSDREKKIAFESFNSSWAARSRRAALLVDRWQIDSCHSLRGQQSAPKMCGLRTLESLCKIV